MVEASPSGTVTFLFTDMKGSTRLWENHEVAMRAALARHDEIVRSAIEGNDGYVFSTAGDAFAAAFGRASDAAAAAATAQRHLREEAWPDDMVVGVRIGLHTGEAQERGGDYFGPDVNRAARVMAAANAGQVLMSSSTAELLGHDRLTDLGEHRLKDLGVPTRLWQLGSESFGPVRSLDTVRNNLPVQRTELLGRSDEIDKVIRLVGSSPVVTLTGIGGAGKTRLALAVAGQLTADYPDGLFFVDLSPITDGDLVASAVAEVVGVSLDAVAVGDGSETRQLVRALAGRRSFLVLDNCEHLIDEVADVVLDLSSTGGPLQILATSREALEVEGERTFRVPSLPVLDEDGGDGPALQLLIERAIAVNDSFEASGPERDALIGVCEHVDGIPLAIELAAAQLRHLSPTELLDQLGDRFRMLVGGRQRRRQRQQTLQAMMDWSWELLDENERRLFAELSVFSGGWTLRAAGGICSAGDGSVPELMGSLVGKSLVTVDQNRWGSRYGLLETVRLYGQLRLGASGATDELRTRHARWYASWVDEWSFEDQWLSGELASRLRADFDNLRAAVDWLTRDGTAPDPFVRILRGCTYLWRENFVAGEALRWTELLDYDSMAGGDLARALLARADAEYVNGDYDGMRGRAEHAYREALSTGADTEAAAALTIMSQGLAIPDPERSRAQLNEAVELARGAGASRIEATALGLLDFSLRVLDVPLEERRPMVERAVSICGPDGWDFTCAQGAMARQVSDGGDPRAAIEISRQAAEAAEDIGLPLVAARRWLEMGWEAAIARDDVSWRTGLSRAVQHYRDAASGRGLADAVLGIALWEALHGDALRASRLLATSATTQLNDQGSYETYRRCRNLIVAANLPADDVAAARLDGQHSTVEIALEEEFERLGIVYRRNEGSLGRLP